MTPNRTTPRRETADERADRLHALKQTQERERREAHRARVVRDKRRTRRNALSWFGRAAK